MPGTLYVVAGAPSVAPPGASGEPADPTREPARAGGPWRGCGGIPPGLCRNASSTSTSSLALLGASGQPA
eukprot:6282637-Alexandrium_andersonii.AAC.1